MPTADEILRSLPSSNPLVAYYDADPAGWRPYWYTEYVDLGVTINSQGTAVVKTDFSPFIWTHTTHGLVGEVDNPEWSGYYNDGQYLIKMSDQRTNYMQKPVPANLAFGPHKEGPFSEMSMPIFFPGDHSVTFEFTNLWTRVLTPIADTFRIYICMRGIQYWGTLRPPEELMRFSKGQ